MSTKMKKIKKSKLRNASPKKLHSLIQNGEIDIVDIMQIHFPKKSRKELKRKIVIKP